MASDAARIAAEIQTWSDDYLRRQIEVGEAGFADRQVWAALLVEAARRTALGASLGPPQASAAGPQAAPASYYGVRGWLALYVLGCFLAPFLVAGLLVGAARQAGLWLRLSEVAPVSAWGIVFTVGVLVALTCLRLWVGIQLLRRRPSGALFAAALLVADCIFIVTTAGLTELMLGELTDVVATRTGTIPTRLQRLEPDLLLRVCAALAAALAWLMYFFKSRRVRATYGPVTWPRIRAVLAGRPLDPLSQAPDRPPPN